MSTPRVIVFLDYQNVHLTAHQQFHDWGTPKNATHVDPIKLGELLIQRRKGGGTLEQVRLYRGQPLPERQAEAAAAANRQADIWEAEAQTKVIRRPLRYPHDWPDSPAQEKGIDVRLAIDFVRLAYEKRYDVGILFSRDTDLIPCLETVVAHRLAHVEVASWDGCRGLRLTDRPLWCHYLTEDDYDTVRDYTDYALG